MGKKANEFYFKLFKNSSSSAEMAIDGGDTFTVTGVESGSVEIQRINFLVVDGAMKYGVFGGLAAALTNGVEIKAYDENDSVLIDFTDGGNIKANEDFCLLAGVDAIAEPTAGDDFMPIRWTVAKAGEPLVLRSGDYIQIKTQDDMAAVTTFRAMAQGVKL